MKHIKIIPTLINGHAEQGFRGPGSCLKDKINMASLGLNIFSPCRASIAQLCSVGGRKGWHMEHHVGSHAYLSWPAQKHYVNLGPLRTRHQDRFGCARHL